MQNYLIVYLKWDVEVLQEYEELYCDEAINMKTDIKYEGLHKLFYEKEFFLSFAEQNNLNIKFTISDTKGYWNNDFILIVICTRICKCFVLVGDCFENWVDTFSVNMLVIQRILRKET